MRGAFSAIDVPRVSDSARKKYETTGIKDHWIMFVHHWLKNFFVDGRTIAMIARGLIMTRI